MGIGQSFRREVMTRASWAAQPTHEPLDGADAKRVPRKSWGRNYEKSIGRAQSAIQAANAKDPRIVPYLLQTGLGNDVGFIKKVHAALQRRQR